MLPIRLFLALGWGRAAAEKLPDPEWWDGTAIREYVTSQLAQEAVTIAPYAMVMSLWSAAARPLGVGIMLALVTLALCLLVGYRTRAALALGMLFNVNFVLAGETNPSAFYLVLALAVLVGDCDALPGCDRRRRQRSVRPPVVADRHVLPVSGAALAVAAAALGPHVSTVDPALLVEDPAVVLFTVATLAILAWLLRRLTNPAADRSAPEFARDHLIGGEG